MGAMQKVRSCLVWEDIVVKKSDYEKKTLKLYRKTEKAHGVKRGGLDRNKSKTSSHARGHGGRITL